MATISELLLDHEEDDRPAVLVESGAWTFRQLLAEARSRAALFEAARDPARPPHIGVLLDNAPDYVFWLAAAALSGGVVVGINSTYRGGQLAQLIDHTECQMIVTTDALAPLLADAGSAVPDELTFTIDDSQYLDRLSSLEPFATPKQKVVDDDLFLLVFTSGSTGLPKAVRCTQGRLARTGAHVAGVAGLAATDVVYSPLPFFHSSSLFTGWSSSLNAGAAIATRRRFSASQTVADVVRHGATVMTYTGKVLNYILAVPESATDSEVPLRLAVGNEASERDIKDFARRFGCTVRDSYGSTEGVVIIRRDPTMPGGALGRSDDTIKVLSPETGLECPPVVRDEAGRALNLEAAAGEIVATEPTSSFEGYLRGQSRPSSRAMLECAPSPSMPFRTIRQVTASWPPWSCTQERAWNPRPSTTSYVRRAISAPSGSRPSSASMRSSRSWPA